MNKSNMSRLGIFWNIGVFISNGRCYTQERFGRYLDSLAPFFAEIAVFTPARSCQEAECSYVLFNKNIIFYPLQAANNVSGLFEKAGRYLNMFRSIKKDLPDYDLVYVYLPSNLGLLGAYAAMMHGIPLFTYVGGDIEDALVHMDIIRLTIMKKIYSFFYLAMSRSAISRSRFCIAAGKMLKEKLSSNSANVFQAVSRVDFRPGDIYIRRDTCNGPVVKLLYVGRLSKAKGIFYLLEALRILIEKEHAISLTLVGKDCTSGELDSMIRELNLEDHVKLAGYIPNGKKLFYVFRRSDIFVLPSLSEGFPRVIYEAMANSLPVITTSVGGIPFELRNESDALLIQPSSAKEIVNAVEQMLSTPDLRRKLIKNGVKRALDVSRHEASTQLIELVRSHFSEKINATGLA